MVRDPKKIYGALGENDGILPSARPMSKPMSPTHYHAMQMRRKRVDHEARVNFLPPPSPRYGHAAGPRPGWRDLALFQPPVNHGNPFCFENSMVPRPAVSYDQLNALHRGSSQQTRRAECSIGANSGITAKIGASADGNPERRTRFGRTRPLSDKIGGWPEQVEQANRAYNRQLVAEMPDKQQHAAAPEPMVPAVADEPLEFVLQSDYKASFPHYRDIQCNRSRFRMRNADTDYRERALRQFGSLGKGYRS